MQTVTFTFLAGGQKLTRQFTPEQALLELAHYRENWEEYRDIPHTFLADIGDGVVHIVHRARSKV